MDAHRGAAPASRNTAAGGRSSSDVRRAGRASGRSNGRSRRRRTANGCGCAAAPHGGRRARRVLDCRRRSPGSAGSRRRVAGGPRPGFPGGPAAARPRSPRRVRGGGPGLRSRPVHRGPRWRRRQAWRARHSGRSRYGAAARSGCGRRRSDPGSTPWMRRQPPGCVATAPVPPARRRRRRHTARRQATPGRPLAPPCPRSPASHPSGCRAAPDCALDGHPRAPRGAAPDSRPVPAPGRPHTRHR